MANRETKTEYVTLPNGKEYSVMVVAPSASEPEGHVCITAYWETIKPHTAHLCSRAQEFFQQSRHVSTFGVTGKKVLAALKDADVLADLEAVNVALVARFGADSAMTIPAAPAATMTTEQVQAAIAGHDLTTFWGWTSAAKALLADKPAGTALHDDPAGFVALINGSLCAFPANRDGSLTFTTENGFPEEGCDPDESAWSDRGCWDGSTPEHDARVLTQPVFVTLTFVEA